MTATAAVCTAASGSENQPRGPRSRCSRTERTPAPSETTARSPVLDAAACEHHLAADGEADAADAAVCSRRAVAAARRRRRRCPSRPPSRTGSGRPRCRRSRARRAGARRSRGGRASAPAAACPAGSGTRSPRRRCGRGRTRRRGRGRRSSGASPPRTARPRSAGATSARGRCVARIADRDRDDEPVGREHGCDGDPGSAQVAEPAGLARAPERARRRARAGRARPGGAGSRSSPRRGRRRRGRPRSRAPLPRARGRRRPPRARPARPRAGADRQPRRARATASDASPRSRWSPGPVPGSGATNESTAACTATIAVAPENRSTSRRADASLRGEREPRPPADALELECGLMHSWSVDRVTSSRAAGRRHARAHSAAATVARHRGNPRSSACLTTYLAPGLVRMAALPDAATQV